MPKELAYLAREDQRYYVELTREQALERLSKGLGVAEERLQNAERQVLNNECNSIILVISQKNMPWQKSYVKVLDRELLDKYRLKDT